MNRLEAHRQREEHSLLACVPTVTMCLSDQICPFPAAHPRHVYGVTVFLRLISVRCTEHADLGDDVFQVRALSVLVPRLDDAGERHAADFALV